MGIPKVIHYCWFGGNPMPKSAIKCINSWEKFFPDYSIKLWDESNYNVRKVSYTSEAYDAKKYAFVSDYARFDILYKYGGIYFDTDVQVIKGFGDILIHGPFLGCEIDATTDNTSYKTIAVAPGLGMAAPSGLEFYGKIIEYYSKIHFIKPDGSYNEETVVRHVTKMLLSEGLKNEPGIQNVAGINIYPKEYFNPLNDNTGELMVTCNTHSIHWYTKTWQSPRLRLRNRITRVFHRYLGEDVFNRYKDCDSSKSRKVLQVCAYAAPYEGIFLKSIFAIENKLLEYGIKTIYAFPETAKNISWCIELSKRTKVYFLPLARARIKPACYQMVKRIYTDNPDIAISHSHFELYDMPVALMASRNVRVIWHLHDSIIKQKGLRGYLDRIQYSKIWKNVTLISVSEKNRKDAVDLGFPDRQTITILNAIDLDRIEFRKQSNVSEEPYTFLLFGWAFERKGVDIVIEATKLLNNRISGIPFLIRIVGDENTWNSVKVYAEKNGKIPSNIVQCNKAEDVNSFFQKSQCFVSASRKETFSYAVCEAAYAGLQVISSDIPGLEWAHELPTVYFFESESAYQLSKQMEKVLLTNEITERIYQTREIITEKYGIDRWVEKVINSYKL